MNTLLPILLLPSEHHAVADRTLALLESSGVYLTQEEITEIEEYRKDKLMDSERIEFDSWGFNVLLEELAESGGVDSDRFLEVALPAISLFYEIRGELDATVSDEEVASAIIEALSCENGAFECIDAHEIIASLSPALPSLAEELAQSETHNAYFWNEEDWVYDEYTPGWDGEAWEGDYEERD